MHSFTLPLLTYVDYKTNKSAISQYKSNYSNVRKLLMSLANKVPKIVLEVNG